MNKFGISLLLILPLFLALPPINSQISSETAKCPEVLSKIGDVCSKVKCDHEVSKDLCPKGTIYEHSFALCGCCPKCVQYLKPSDDDLDCVPNDSNNIVWIPDADCDEEKDHHCPVRVNTCLPGLLCNTTSTRCELPPNSWVPDPEKAECMFRKSLYLLELHHWEPDCEPDGSFSPKQCKGSAYDGECFCVSKIGKRVFGREWRLKSENQTCACSRKVAELRNEQRYISTLHCTPEGNYEPLQCDTDSGLCYCVDEKTGVMDGVVVHQSDWKSLPCYSLNVTNGDESGKYLRMCESEFAAGTDLRMIGNDHGTKIDFKSLNCDFDGSYGPVQAVDTLSQCVFKNGTRIKDYFKARDGAMTCNCARDIEEYLPSQNRPIKLACQMQTGNFDVAYDFGTSASCVDSDGFLYGDLVESRYQCCLLNEGCAQHVLDEICYKEEFPDRGHRPCSWWRYRN